jgi:hypothetical protein
MFFAVTTGLLYALWGPYWEARELRRYEGLEVDPRSQGPSLDYWRPSFPDLGRFAEAVRRKLFRWSAGPLIGPHERFRVLPDGRKLVTLKDAADYVTKLPKKESELPEWQTAIEALMLCSRSGDPMLARIGSWRRSIVMWSGGLIPIAKQPIGESGSSKGGRQAVI